MSSFHQPNPANSFHDQHTVETPEQTELRFELAGIGSRALALMLDTLLQIAALLLIVSVMVFAVGLTRFKFVSEGGVWVGALVIGLGFLLLNGYFAGFEIFWNGQTPGKRWIGLRVVKESGRPLTAAETIGRNLLRMVDQLPGFYGIAIVTAMLNSKNRRLGDFVAGSIVVRESSLADVRPFWETARISDGSFSRPPGIESLTPDDLVLIDKFLMRRYSLPLDVRDRLARQILEKLEHRIKFTPEQRMAQEKTLELLVRERRGTGS